jgi:hypothetical protein
MQRFASMRPSRALLPFLCLATLFGVTPAADLVHAQSGLAGGYEPSPQRMEVKVSTWGEDCGTRPAAQVINETGKVTVKDEGAHLSLRFATRSVRTNSCWSQNPSLTLVSATSANGNYRAECRTSAGDPKREIGRYTLTASAGTLELTEESDYDWQLKSSHCVAKVRVTQTLTAVGRAKPAPEPSHVDAGSLPAVPPAPAEEEKCVPGPAVRLRMRPTDARIAPGERTCFVIRAVDASGCPLALADSPIELTLQRPTGVQGTVSGSCFRAAESAALAEGVFKVLAASGNLRAEADVVVAAPDLSDITARRVGSGTSTTSTSGRAADTSYETGVRAVARSSRDSLWLGIGVAGLAGVIALLSFVALRAARKSAPAKRPRPRSSYAERVSSEAAAEPGPTQQALPTPADLVAASGPQRICPKCRRGYPPGSERCASDGEALLDYDDFVAGKAQHLASRFCPECGQAIASDALFCGACGHKLSV